MNTWLKMLVLPMWHYHVSVICNGTVGPIHMELTFENISATKLILSSPDSHHVGSMMDTCRPGMWTHLLILPVNDS